MKKTITFMAVTAMFGACTDAGLTTDQVGQAVGGIDANLSDGGADPGGGPNVFHSSMKGGGAFLMFYDPAGSNGNINVYESGVGPNRTASLSFTIQAPD